MEINNFGAVVAVILDLFCMAVMFGEYLVTKFILQKTPLRMKKTFTAIIIGSLLIAISNDIWVLGLGGILKLNRLIVNLINIFYFIAMSSIPAFWMNYVLGEGKSKLIGVKGHLFILLIPAYFCSLLAITSPFNGLLFTVSEDLVYSRGPLFILYSIITYAYMLVSCVIALVRTFKNKHIDSVWVKHLAMAISSIIAIIFTLLQTFTRYEFATVGFTGAILVYFAYLIIYTINAQKYTIRTQIEHNKTNAEKIENYQKAILSESKISLEIDLTKNLLVYGEWKNAYGEFVDFSDVLGISLPCSYDLYIIDWCNRFVQPESKDIFLSNTLSKFLLDDFKKGIYDISFDYKAATLEGAVKFFRRNIVLIQNNDGDIIAYTNVKDVTEILEAEDRERSYILALSNTYDSVDVVQLNREKKTDIIVRHSRVSDLLKDYVSEEWIKEQGVSKRLSIMTNLVYEEDRERFFTETRREYIFEQMDEKNIHIVKFRIPDKHGNLINFEEHFIPLQEFNGTNFGMIACIRNVDYQGNRHE